MFVYISPRKVIQHWLFNIKTQCVGITTTRVNVKNKMRRTKMLEILSGYVAVRHYVLCTYIHAYSRVSCSAVSMFYVVKDYSKLLILLLPPPKYYRCTL